MIVRALSLRQPWAAAVVHGGKRIENRLRWKGSSFRGLILLHAATGMTAREYNEAIEFLVMARISWRPDPTTLLRGGFIGRAVVTGTVATESDLDALVVEDPTFDRLWWMGGFALILDHVSAIPYAPWKGALGLFGVDTEAVAASLPEGQRAAWRASVD